MIDSSSISRGLRSSNRGNSRFGSPDSRFSSQGRGLRSSNRGNNRFGSQGNRFSASSPDSRFNSLDNGLSPKEDAKESGQDEEIRMVSRI